MKKICLAITVLLTLMFLMAACTENKGKEVTGGNNIESQTTTLTKPNETPKAEPKDAAQYATGMWDGAKMNGLEPPQADITGEMQDTGVVKYLFMNIKRDNAKKYVQYLKDSGYTESPVELTSTSYRAVKGGYEVIFSCSDFNSEDIGGGEIQMVKK